jgi:tetratricopeptide (TPR) repeat protein
LGVLLHPASATSETPAADRRGTARAGASVVRAALVALVLGVAAWCVGDSWWNVAVPTLLARGDVRRAEHLLPTLAYPYQALLGAAQGQQGDFAAAERTLLAAGQGYQDIRLYRNLGYVYVQQGKWAEAASIYQRWAATGLDHSNALSNLAVAYEQLGQATNAVAALDRQQALWPRRRSPDEVKRLAVLLLRGGAPERALRRVVRYEREIRRLNEPLPADLDNIAGAALLRLGRLPEAEARFRTALAKDPSLASAKRNLATVHDAARERPPAQ